MTGNIRARIALVAVNLAVVSAFLLSYSRHGVGFGPYRIDLGVYRLGGRTWLHGGNLYGQVLVAPRVRLPFTYPPIAAIVLAPLALLPMAAAGTVLTVGSVALIAVVLAVFLRRLAGPVAGSPWAVGWLLPAALLLEPVRSTLAYGQINIVLMALVALDCLTAEPRWPRGALTGLAAAVKLTPAAFVLFFLLRRDYRAAATAGVSFAAATAAGFALAGPDSARYWTAIVFQTGRIGAPATATNQCIQAVLARAGLDPHTLPGAAAWLLLSAVVVVAACRGMRHALAASQDCLALSLNAFAALQPGPAARPAVFVLFGATGDLAKRMVLPAFYQLACQGLLPRQWLLVGNGRGDLTHEDFRAHVHDALTEFGPKPEGQDWDSFAQRVLFAGGGFSSGSPGSLPDVLGQARTSLGDSSQLVYYLAVPPVAFGGLTQALGQYGLARGARVVYEKPFGTSPDSFRELDRIVHSVLDEEQVYRIDHFLGKEATQDLHVLRFANTSSAAFWNREHIEAVQIDVPETLGISDRAEFYDATGAVLDMLVTHLFQVAAEVAMEPPASLDAPGLQAARGKVIGCFQPLDPQEVVLGQFDGYREVPGVDPQSGRDTFVAARLWIDNPRWRGVPFYLRTGKRLAASKQRVTLILREPPGPLAGQLPREANLMSFSLGGDGEIDLSLVAKKPGPALDLDVARASIPLASLHGADPLPPYVRLIHDVLLGDRSLFTRPDGLAAAWRAAEPLLTSPPPVRGYPPGSWGPAEARELIAPGQWLLGQ